MSVLGTGLLLIEVSVNPLTPKSDQYITSPYNFNTLSSRQVMRIKKLSTRGCCLDITPNSQEYATKKCMALR